MSGPDVDRLDFFRCSCPFCGGTTVFREMHRHLPPVCRRPRMQYDTVLVEFWCAACRCVVEVEATRKVVR